MRLAASLILFLSFISVFVTAVQASSPPSRLHYRPDGGFIGDVHPVFYQGKYYLPHLTANRSRSLLFVSQLLVSEDLIHWTPEPIEVTGFFVKESGVTGERSWRSIPLPKKPETGEEDAFQRQMRETLEGIVGDTVPRFWLVTVMQDPISGKLFAFYPYHGIRMLTSDDMRSWELYFHNPVLTGDMNRFSEFRDPFVFWNPLYEEYWMVLTTSIAGEEPRYAGAISYARSKDLTDWEFGGILYHPGNAGSPECPEMFELDGRWYLLAGFKTLADTVGPTEYVVSDSPTGPFRRMPVSLLAGTDHIVGNTLFDGERRIVMGWIPTYAGDEALRRPEWGGDLALPREVYAGEDGVLYTRLPKEFEQIRGDALYTRGDGAPDRRSGQVETSDGVVVVPPGAPYGRAALPGTYGRFDLKMTVTLDESALAAGIILRGDSGKPGLELAIDLRTQQLVVRRHGSGAPALAWQPIDVKPHEAMTLRVIVEEDILEAFLDDRFSLAARLPERIDNHALEIFAEGGAEVSDIDVRSISL